MRSAGACDRPRPLNARLTVEPASFGSNRSGCCPPLPLHRRRRHERHAHVTAHTPRPVPAGMAPGDAAGRAACPALQEGMSDAVVVRGPPVDGVRRAVGEEHAHGRRPQKSRGQRRLVRRAPEQKRKEVRRRARRVTGRGFRATRRPARSTTCHGRWQGGCSSACPTGEQGPPRRDTPEASPMPGGRGADRPAGVAS